MFSRIFSNLNSFIILVNKVLQIDKYGGELKICQLFETQYNI